MGAFYKAHHVAFSFVGLFLSCLCEHAVCCAHCCHGCPSCLHHLAACSALAILLVRHLSLLQMYDKGSESDVSSCTRMDRDMWL